MSDNKKYWLKNGLAFDCEKGLDGYIRGLEVSRDYLGAVHPVNSDAFNVWLDEAHSVKSAGQLTETEYLAKLEAEKPVAGGQGVETQTVAAGDVGQLTEKQVVNG